VHQIDISVRTTKNGFEYHESFFAPVESKYISVLPVAYLDTWHTYRLDWTPDTLVWYLDGKEMHRVQAADGAPVPWYGRHGGLTFEPSESVARLSGV
jgi:beta-glucanase (GH16 family)